MATSTVSGFLPRRKQSISNGFGAEGHQLNLPPSMMPPTASPGPGTPSSYNGSSYPFHGDSSRASTSTTASSATLVNGHAPHSHHPAHMMYNASGSNTPANNSSISLVSGSTLANSSNGMGGASNNSPAAASSSADGGIGASLIPGAPLAANNMSNKPANAGSSLYQSCLNLRDRLWRVDGFGPAYLTGSDADAGVGESSPTVDSSNTSAPSSPKSKAVNAKDPVTQLWHCFRRGSPLCVLLNKLGPKTELPTTVPPATGGKVEGVGAVNKPNDCKKLVAKFIMALKTELGFQTEEIFTISQLYLNDTNGFVRVVRTISKVLDVFEERGLLVPSQKPDLEHELEDDAKPGDDRARVVRELLDTERKYVMDLETLQGFAKALAQNAILPPDTIHNLFGNLNTMVDVQRRFLICVEENARRPVDDQHFGHVFRTMERDFTVYEPFCANYAQALDIIVNEAQNIMRLKGMPAAEDCFLEPTYELPTFLIKPVQRICKYHLILEQLLKRSSPDAPYLEELREGYTIIKGVADRVNETRRLQENAQIVQELSARVEDWKGHNVHSFGHLLLSDVFMVAKGDSEREYHVYLFEKILLCCKEVLPNVNKKNSKSNSLLKQKSGSVSGPAGAKKTPKNSLLLKGRIFINNVTGAFAGNKAGAVMGLPSGTHALQVWWRGDYDQESFSLRCKNDEQLRQWQNALNKLIEEVHIRRQQLASQYQSGTNSPANMAGTGTLQRRITATQSQFPQTPVQEQGGFFPLTRAESHRTNEDVGAADDDQMEGLREPGSASLNGSFSGRGTPIGFTRMSQPAEPRDRKLSLTQEATRPRAHTEDQESATLQQWRSQSTAPPLPRSSISSADQHNSLRKASSSRQLRQPGYTGQTFSGYPRPPRQGADAVGGDAHGAEVSAMEHGAANDAGSRGSDAAEHTAEHLRSRSASNPHAFHLPVPMQQKGLQRGHPHALQTQHLQGLPRPDPRHSQEQDGASMLNYLKGNAAKRASASSQSTVDSVRSNKSGPDSTAASSPVTRSGSSGAGSTQPAKLPSGSNNNVVKVVVVLGEDRYTLAVLFTVTFEELVHKVINKVRAIAGRSALPENGIKLRYIDEDGDRIIMKDDDDVLMAFEAARSAGADVQLIIA